MKLRQVSSAALVVLACTALSGAAWSGNGKPKGKNKFHVTPLGPIHVPGGGYGYPARSCPPGLAKKTPPCIPPGQAKKYYRTGDRILDGYSHVGTPGRWGLRPGGYYLRAGDYIYEVSRDTHKVLNLVGAVVDILQ